MRAYPKGVGPKCRLHNCYNIYAICGYCLEARSFLRVKDTALMVGGACCVIDRCPFCIKDLRPLMDPGQVLLENEHICHTGYNQFSLLYIHMFFMSRVAKQNCVETLTYCRLWCGNFNVLRALVWKLERIVGFGTCA